MSRFLLRNSVLASAIVSLLTVAAVAQGPPSYMNPAPEPSMTSKISSSVKSGFSKVSNALMPKTSAKKAPDPISLAVPAKPSPQFHVAIARMAENSGDLAKAEHHYREAIRLDPGNLEGLLGYAHMLDRQRKLAQAADLYRMAVRSKPNNPTVHNDLGICYARQGMLDEAVASIERAVQLKPDQPRYRNNIATVLVQSKRLDAAYEHLSAVHPKPIAYYNLGYLLQGAGDKRGAARLFQEALALDPSLTQAQVWLQKLTPALADAQPTMTPQDAAPARPPQVVARRAAPAASAPSTPPMIVPPRGSAAPLPPSGSLAPLPQIGTTPPETAPQAAAPPQFPPRELAPLPSIKPLPPVSGNP